MQNALCLRYGNPCLFNRDDLGIQVQLDRKVLQVTQDKTVVMVLQDPKDLLVHRYTLL